MYKFIKKHLAVFIIALVAIIFISTVIFYNQAYGILSFGGDIVDFLPCTCSGGIWIHVVSISTNASFVYIPGVSILHEAGQIFRPGPTVLGTYTPGGVCVYFGASTCHTRTVTGGTIITVGTSVH